jgi:eukaryotic-like serine/threonine-protein kinase
MSNELTPVERREGLPMDLSGRQLGDYHLLRRLGRGGMAEVYLAEQQSLGRPVAVKVLKPSLAQNDSYVRRFIHEAKAAAALVHANIVQIHEVGCIDGLHFIAQEYIEGLNLRQVLDRRGPLEAPSALNVMRQVAAALHKASQQKIVHRDIKPENIMLGVGGEVKVADFGLARVEKGGESVNLTQIGVTMGTPLYMSPEQVEGKPVDVRSDIYSFGITCYHMLAARPPFEGDTPLKIAIQHLQNEPRRLEDLRSDLPGGICRIVHKMIAKRPQDRYQNATELLRELRTVQIEGADESWAAGIEDWNLPEIAALSASLSEATQQLAAVIGPQSRPRWKRLGMPAAAMILGGLLLGVLSARISQPAALLQVPSNNLVAVERQPTVRDQYFHAISIGSEEAWLSIAKYFPPSESEENQYYALRGLQRLAELYQEAGALDRALECYRELASPQFDDLFRDLRASGLAGLANVFLAQGELQKARQQLSMLAQLLPELPFDIQQMLINEVNAKLRPELRQFIRDLEPRNGARLDSP